MDSNIATLIEFLEIPLGSADGVFEKFMKLPNAIARGERLKRFLYVRGNCRNKVLLVAHADTHWDESFGYAHKIRHGVTCENLVIRSTNSKYGLGADDRAGCAIIWLLKDLGHSLLITSGEEQGQIGSRWLMNENSDIAEEINRGHQFMVQLDRRNGRDFKCYSVGTPSFREYIDSVTGYTEPDRTSYTDIVTLCRDITGVNLSIGYREEHSSEECLYVDEWLHTLNLCRKWLSAENLPKFHLVC